MTYNGERIALQVNSSISIKYSTRIRIIDAVACCIAMILVE